MKCEEIQDGQIRKALEPKRVEVEAGDKEAALELLRDRRLLDRVIEDSARCGVVGEEINKKVAYLAAVSRRSMRRWLWWCSRVRRRARVR